MTLRRRKPSSTSTPATISDLVHLWQLRILVPLGGYKTFITTNGFSSDKVATAIGLGGWIDDDDRDFDAVAVRRDLRDMHRTAEACADQLALPATLQANIARLAGLVGLSPTDCRILAFATMINQHRQLDDCADTLGQMNSLKLYDTLATLLHLDPRAVSSALGPHGVLARSGLLSVDRGGSGYLASKLDLVSGTFADAILACDADPLMLLRDTICLSPLARLALTDFAHIGKALAILRPYLEQAVANGQRGVNIFLHGAPGTGKSELARALAAALSSELLEVASEDTDGDPVTGERRLRAYRAAQSLLGQRQALILFDEVEDVFNDGEGMFGRKSTAQRRKAWLNRMLEQNKVPTLWLANSIDGIDPAFIRRFDIVIDMPVPPRAQRERIVRAACTGLLDEPAIQRIARSDELAPAVVSRAASVVHRICDRLGATGTARAVEWLIDQSLEAQGHMPLRQAAAGRLPAIYDASLLNADVDMTTLAQGLKATGAGRLCLYGPPGTGKTAYGRWLAEHLGMPLLACRASDLMSKWVGGSEKNIAAAFQRAERENALLLIDEVDSFLQDRAQARQSWETTMVNEMLTQMETFSGLFIASTNLMDGLDPAALRRFDMKIRFDYLAAGQAAQLLGRYCSNLEFPAPSAEDLAAMHRLVNLTPGDFAAVARRNWFSPIASAAAFVRALEGECALKRTGGRSIGFVS
ncbi:AAA family ATPase [Massilia dura]|uniref:AAA family ATPase n=2 Tax=Pseudoduganella dura TaxID=321982 RepID=A0A6I3XQN8_9BURK|nr:ATP-binding protein [Pseudoduganella dura]MUI14095.1 AAA family ATPase [Pseudoduganella dura]GGX77156.1 ATPase [Pseudoduganella dura]